MQVLDANGCAIDTRVLIPEQANNLVIRAGVGNDTIEVDPNIPVRLTVLGGRGNDEIGARTASQGIRIGGSGDDVIYGGQGHDQIDIRAMTELSDGARPAVPDVSATPLVPGESHEERFGLPRPLGQGRLYADGLPVTAEQMAEDETTVEAQ